MTTASDLAYPKDVERILRVVLAAGHSCTSEQVDSAWRHYCEEEMDATWLTPYDSDQHILNAVVPYLSEPMHEDVYEHLRSGS